MFALGLGIFTAASARGRARADDRRARRRARGAGRRRRDRDAADADDPLRRGAGGAARRSRSARGAASAASPSRSARSSAARSCRGISWHWIFWLNVPIGLVLLPLALLAARRELRARRAGSTCPASGSSSAGLLRDRLGPRPRQRARLDDRRRSSARSSAGALADGGVRRVGAARTERRCCRCASSATARSRSRTSRRCFMFFGMFGSIFLLAQFFQTVQGYSPLQSGLRILPWTAMPMFVAPIAGALSDRIGGHRLMGIGLALQAIGLAWIAAVSTADDAVRRARRAVRALRHRHGALLRAGRERRALVGRGTRRRARPRARTTRSASSAASSASRCSPRSSRTTAATRPASRSWTG